VIGFAATTTTTGTASTAATLSHSDLVLVLILTVLAVLLSGLVVILGRSVLAPRTATSTSSSADGKRSSANTGRPDGGGHLLDQSTRF
jgi:hypothetical protein